MSKHRYTTELEFGGHPVVVEYTYSPGTPDVMYLPNGDPGYPGDPPELEVYSVTACWAPGVELIDFIEDLGGLDRLYEAIEERAQFGDPPDEPERLDEDFFPYEGRYFDET